MHPEQLVILGTGSHAAVFDGTKIIRQASSLGYLLGDEGGGSDIGKELIKAYFYQQLPPKIAADMETMINGDRSDFYKDFTMHRRPINS
jgi:N-acetylglucosamine kinase-like BadF-type ATPase